MVKPAEEKKGKWVEWCTTDIEVFVGDKGLYPGAKGLVFDLIDKETICVFLPVIGEVVNLPLSHVSFTTIWFNITNMFVEAIAIQAQSEPKSPHFEGRVARRGGGASRAARTNGRSALV